ncbi:Uncharacterized protein At4g02000 [Linum grandiflorum]
MAAPAFVLSSDDFTASSHILTQSLLARFFWPEPRPLRLVQSSLACKWRLVGSIRISPESDGLYQLFISNKSDVSRVLGQRPLSFERHLIGVQRWATPSPTVADRLRFIDFWVRLLDLPKPLRSSEVGKGLASVIGKVIDAGLFDSATEPDYFVRCLVRVDVEKGLYGRREIQGGQGSPVYVQFQYEGLRQVCYCCGSVRHFYKFCPELGSRVLDLQERNGWMVAPPLKCRRLHPETLEPLKPHPSDSAAVVSQAAGEASVKTSTSQRARPIKNPPPPKAGLSTTH